MSDFDWDHLDIDEEEGDEATGEDDDDPTVEDGDVLHDGQVHQGEVRPIRGYSSKVCQVVHLQAMMTFAKTKKMGCPFLTIPACPLAGFLRNTSLSTDLIGEDIR